MIPIICTLVWLVIHQKIFIEGYTFEKYYSTKDFTTFYKSISLTPGTYNNIFLLNKIFEALDSEKNVSETCLKELHLFRESSINSSELWPLIMLDASGGFQAGMFQGNLNHLGDWSQCASVKSRLLKASPCQAKVSLGSRQVQNSSNPYHNVPVVFNLCLPSNCRSKDLEILVDGSLPSPNITVQFECFTEPDVSYSYLLIIVATLILFLVGSSAYDLYYLENANKTNVCNAFAVQRNWKVLFSSTTSDRTLSCLFGLKFLTQFVVIWYHLVMHNMSLFQPFINKFILAEVMESWRGSYYMALTLSVDTYLVMSGLLVCYTAFGKTSKYKNLFQYYLHRYIRLTPPLVVVILAYLLGWRLMCSGPQCKYLRNEKESCEKYWWTNLLYLNNYYPHFKQTCVKHSWYLALDWQLYMASPAILHLTAISRKRSTALATLASLLIAAIVIPFIYTYTYSLPTEEFYLYKMNDINDYYSKFYTPMETRFGPWIIGFTLGLIIKMDEIKYLQTRSWLKGTGWLLSVVIMAACLIINVPDLQIKEKNILVNAIHNALKKNLWGIGMAWIILACSQGIAGPLNRFLSWRPFEPLSKLSYGAYLIHRAVIAVFFFHARTPIYYSFLNQVIVLTGVLVVTYIISLLLYLSIEAPFCNLDRLLLAGTTGKAKTKAIK